MWFMLVNGELIEVLKILSNGTFVIKMKKKFQNKLGSTYHDIFILGKCIYLETEEVLGWNEFQVVLLNKFVGVNR